ncbi:MAG: outer membrane lipoprotein carrier protein LolA [Desulfobacteraceae bacterium]|jgi:outer membrane lipoprotein carrier protein|nr:MAG: outer membrane lipoprotein carrier protein LolA [Desulfobacteraceae bacterium]
MKKLLLIAAALIVWLIFGMIMAGSPVVAAAETADATDQLAVEEIMDRLVQRFGAADFSADFSQESTLAALDIRDTATGRVWIKHPGRMRWEYATPEIHAIITDGKTLWIYRPEDRQVIIGDALAYFGDGKGASFLSNIRLIPEAFTVSVAPPAGEGLHTLRLVPHRKQLDLNEIYLNIDKATFDIVGVLTINAYDDQTRLDFKNINFSNDIDENLFHFQAPAGTDVLKLEEGE